MFGDHPDDPALKAAWDQFCDDLKGASELVFRDTTPASGIDRAKGLRLLARNIALALQFKLEKTDPACPELPLAYSLESSPWMGSSGGK